MNSQSSPTQGTLSNNSSKLNLSGSPTSDSLSVRETRPALCTSSIDDVREISHINGDTNDNEQTGWRRLVLPVEDEEEEEGDSDGDPELDTIFNQSGRIKTSPKRSSLSESGANSTAANEKIAGSKTKPGHVSRRKIRAAIFPSPRVAAAPESAENCSSYQTPSPSRFLWHPVQPGYHPSPERDRSIVISQTVRIQPAAQQAPPPPAKDNDTGLKKAIPEMSFFFSVMCLICNVLLPGFGTVIVGLSGLVCSRPRFPDINNSSVVLINLSVGLLQLITTPLLLIGWIWSITWGIAFVTISEECSERKEENNKSNAAVNNNQSEMPTVPSLTAQTNLVTNQTSSDVAIPSNTPSSYSTTTMTTTTTVSLPPITGTPNYAFEHPHPIIVLQEAPVIIQPGTNGISNGRLYVPERVTNGAAAVSSAWGEPGFSGAATMVRRNHHHRRRRRQGPAQMNGVGSGAGAGGGGMMRGGLLSTEALKEIVIHSSIVPEGDQDVSDRKMDASNARANPARQ